VGITGYFWTFTYDDGDINLSGPVVQFTFDISGHFIVTFKVFDAWGNNDYVEIMVYVTDLTPPIFNQDLTNPNATAGRDHMFGVNVTDNINLTAVNCEYWYGNGPHTNITMIHQSDNIWSNMIHIPLDINQTLHYFFYAIDNSSNADVTEVKDITVHDVDGPIFVDNLSDTVATTGDPFFFKVQVMDWIRVANVYVQYVWGVGGTTNVTMTLQLDDVWVHDLTVPSDSLDGLLYRFGAFDTSGNWNWSETVTVIVTDNDAPTLGEDQTPANVTMGEYLHFQITATDNVGVAQVFVIYQFGDDPTVDIDLKDNNGTWNGYLLVPDPGKVLKYMITVHDASGNVNSTSTRTVEIIDIVPPVLVEDLSGALASTGDPFVFQVKVSDNVGISGVSLTYAFGNGAQSNVSMSLGGWLGDGWITLPHPIDIPSDSLSPMSYRFTVEDLSGNVLEGPEGEVSIIDDDSPTILHDEVITSAFRGLAITLEFEVDDNIGVDEVNLVYRFGDGTSTRKSLDKSANTAVIEVPREIEKPLWYSFEAYDAAGNSASTEEVRVGLSNAPPEVEELPTWDVIEETDAEFDLAPYVSDANDPVLTVSCSDESVTIDNMVLKLRHDVAVPDRTVVLTFLDGEDQTDADLTIHVVNVNDLPVITSLLPTDGVKYKEGRTIEFLVDAFDEEGADLTYTWSSGDKVMGTGSFLKYSKLKPGEHVITLVVDDGTDQVEESFTVIVKKEEESPGFGLVAGLAAVVLAGLAIHRRRR
jgi:PGF-CTERM protein